MPHSLIRFEMTSGVTSRAVNRDCPTETDTCDRISRWCDQVSPGNLWCCTRPRGHRGDHVTHHGSSVVAARWAPEESYRAQR